ncbi:hypothetical protein [Aliarcobacter butzleri]|uniref:hypothetical protein n=1 Tax=Aliarcobacter butzleri TaxID=28197 RepID=UPI0011632085|nr:hypothetical protein [Aliarcobacter butzleri]QDM00821.1 hypothetical protein FM022_02920 [Aliarcobacter butzleri]
MKWIFIIFFLLILAVYIVHIMHKRQWRKILGYKPALDEMAIIADLENIQYTQDKIKNIINDYKKGFLDKSTIEAITRDEKEKIKNKKDFISVKENNIKVEAIDKNDIKENYPDDTPIELIEAYENAKYDVLRMLLQKIAYGMVDKSVSQKDKDDFKKIMTYFANRDPLYKEIIIKLIPIIAKEEGILQSKIYPYLPQYDTETLRYVLYFAHELGDITRIKKGRSYQLYTSTYSKIDYLENKDKV